MSIHLVLVCLLNFLFEVAAKPFMPELHISNIAKISLINQPLVVRTPQDDLFSDISNAGDISVFGDNPDLFPSTPEISGDDLALLDSDVYPVNQDILALDVYNGNTEELTAQGPENFDLFVGSSDQVAELPALCPGGHSFDPFIIDKLTTLTSRNLIDDYFDLQIPEEILAPNQLCPNPSDTKKSSPQSTENTSKLLFRVPLPDLAGKRCRIGIGESPYYALCCFMAGNENRENACYPGKCVFLPFFFCLHGLNLDLSFLPDFGISGLYSRSSCIIRLGHVMVFWLVCVLWLLLFYYFLFD